MIGSSLKRAVGTNPFVGPRPFETGRKIFGRDREIDAVYYLLSAERIVLLHSPSGAGKSSLIHAGLIPRLSERFDVWGPTRVNLQPSTDQSSSQSGAVNRYLRSAVLGFEQQIPPERRRPEEQLAKMTLAEYVANRPRRRSASQNIVLIFDQFEEILTTDPLAIEAKHEFFRQWGELLLDPRIWALFAMREDYLPALDPYTQHVPTHLKNWFRLDLLRRDDARDAITGTTAEGGREFDPAAVDKLVTDLATVKVQQPDGTFVKQTGQYVEPLQLQVVCRGLWERMPEDDLRIDLEDIERFGDVTDALAGYYSGEVARLAGGDMRVERAIREWAGDRLITPNGVRGQVLRGVGKSEDLDNELIASLVNTHLVRAEQRAGAVWYELAHDRLIEPVRDNNRQWFDANLHKVQKVATLWEAQGRPEGLLLLGEELTEARQWAEQNESSLTSAERKFLEASDTKQGLIAQEQSIRKMKVVRWFMLGAIIIMSLFSFSLYRQFVAVGKARDEAIAAKSEAERQKGIADGKTVEAEESAKKAEIRGEAARQLAARELAQTLTRLAKEHNLVEIGAVIESIRKVADNKFKFGASETPDATKTGYYWFELYPEETSIQNESKNISRINYIMAHESFQNNLSLGLPANKFRFKYLGWGYVDPVIAVIEYKDSKIPPSISIFDMCEKLGEECSNKSDGR